jgi:hypothetical protein
MADSEDGQSGGSFLKSVVGALALVTAWLFALGWTYLHNYYRYFGININSLDFPVYHYLIFSFTQFVSFRLPGLFLALMITVILALIWVGMKTRRIIWAFLITVCYLLIFWGGFLVAARDARRAAFHDMGPSSALPQFVFELKDGKRLQEHTIQAALDSPDLRLLLQSGDRVFVFEPLQKDPDQTQSAYVNVLQIDIHDLNPSVRVVRVK